MSINLQKGQKIDLSKGGVGGTGLHRVMVGLGWDEAPRSGGGPVSYTHLRAHRD